MDKPTPEQIEHARRYVRENIPAGTPRENLTPEQIKQLDILTRAPLTTGFYKFPLPKGNRWYEAST